MRSTASLVLASFTYSVPEQLPGLIPPKNHDFLIHDSVLNEPLRDPLFRQLPQFVGDTRFNIVKRRSFTEDDDETNRSLHTNIAHVTVHSSVGMWDTA